MDDIKSCDICVFCPSVFPLAKAFQVPPAPVLQRGHVKLLLENRREFALVDVSDLFRHLRYRKPAARQQFRGFSHSDLPEIRRYVLPEDAAKIILHTGLADRKPRGQFPCRMMLPQVGCDDLFDLFCDAHLRFRKIGSDLGRRDFFLLHQQRKQRQGIDLHLHYGRGHRPMIQ